MDVLSEAPWSVAWTGEQEFRLQPSRDFPGMVELDQLHAPGVGTPIFSAVHVTRQRRAMVDFLCHVCGLRTAGEDRYLFPVASGGMVTLHDGTQQYGCNVPPVHRACAQRALLACPHLDRLSERPLRCSRDDGRLIQRTDITPGLEGLASSIPPGQTVVFSCYRLYGPPFTRRVLAAREAWNTAARSRRTR